MAPMKKKAWGLTYFIVQSSTNKPKNIYAEK